MLPSDVALARRLEPLISQLNIHYAEAYDRLFPSEGAAWAAVAGGAVVFAGVGSPLTGASGVGLNGPVAAADLDFIEKFLTSRGATPRIAFSPLADGGLTDALFARGYGVRDFLSINVRELTPSPPSAVSATVGADRHSGDAAVSVVAVPSDDTAGTATWLATVAGGFAHDEPPSPADLRIYRSIAASKSASLWLASTGGTPVGAGVLRILDGVALLSTTSTLPQFRRRGVQSALINARLTAATQAGCDLALIETTPGSDSRRNVARFGFQLVYTQVIVERR